MYPFVVISKQQHTQNKEIGGREYWTRRTKKISTTKKNSQQQPKKKGELENGGRTY